MAERRGAAKRKGTTLFDSLLCANGVAAAVYEAGLLGVRLPLLHILFFAALCIAGYCGVILVVSVIADFPQHERRVYLVVVAANLLPLLVIGIKHLR